LVQTLFYGLFSAWVAWAEDAEEVSQFHWEMAQHSLHVPMVQALFSQLAQAHRLKPLNLLEVLKWTEDAFNRVDRPAFFTKFNKDAAIQYFYEPFLEAFDPELRKQLGVWYTPREIVRYMVSRVDSVLRSELGLKEGLAHESVHILDPCCGTGAYLVEVAATIKHSLEASGAGALLGPKLKAALLQRVHGFELLPAPFVVAHMQIGMLLHQAGAPLKDGDRLSVFLTNALTGWEPPTGIKKQILMAELAEEKEAADKVKRETPILVILGNPPYSGYAGISNMEEERSLSSAYRETKQVRKPEGRGLNDLFVRFFRMAEQKIADGTRQGIVCFISNYSWLDGLSYTGMREAILERFDKIWVDNLNGDKYRTGKLTPTGEPDPSIFSTSTNREGIQVGTAITLMLRKPNHSPCEGLSYREWWGKDKLIQLGMEAQTVSVTKSAAVIPSLPLGLPFRPLSTSTSYQAWKTLPQLFPSFLSGLQTSRDGFLVGIERDQLINRLSVYFDSTRSDETVGILCPEAMAEGNAYDPRLTRTQLLAKGFQSEQVVQYSYRPFDVRWLYWETKSKLLHRPVPEYSPQLFSGNVFLVAQQKPRANWTPCQISSNLVCLDLIDRGASAFPMEIREDQGNHGYSEPHPNLSHEALQHINDLEAGTSDLFFHALAILHAPEYSIDNEDALRQDWPRVPMPTSKVMLEQSAALGRRLSRLLDVNQDPDGIQSPGVGSPLIPVGRFEVTLLPTREPEDYALNIGWGIRGNGGITMPGKGRRTGDRVWLNDRSFWSGISDEIWNYNLGGYQVLKKWLSYRESELLGRELRIDEIEHFTCMARRIAAILQMGPQLDSNYRTFLS